MMDLKEALRMATMFAEVAADVAGVSCVAMLGPCDDGVRWEVVTAETGARVAVGVVAVAIAEATEEALAQRTRGKRAQA